MKLRRPLAEYLQQVEDALGALRDAYVEWYLEEVLTPERANLRVRVRFQNGRLLEINEAVVADDDAFAHLDYRYHCQDSQNRIVFRYDSTPHFPDLPTFPHHKHLPDRTITATRPSISSLLAEAAGHRAL